MVLRTRTPSRRREIATTGSSRVIVARVSLHGVIVVGGAAFVASASQMMLSEAMMNPRFRQQFVSQLRCNSLTFTATKSASIAARRTQPFSCSGVSRITSLANVAPTDAATQTFVQASFTWGSAKDAGVQIVPHKRPRRGRTNGRAVQTDAQAEHAAVVDHVSGEFPAHQTLF